MDILTQLNRAMAYIEAHIEDEIALTDVSSVTTYSPYHFGRLFYYIADIPLSEYIRKRKLSLAAMKLQSGNDKVIDLAVLYGYDSADSFTRAFVKQHGVTPSNARQPGVNFTIFPPLTFQIKIKGVQAMNWRIEERGAFEVFGIEKEVVAGETNDVPAFWDESFNDGSIKKLTEQAKNTSFPSAICGATKPKTKTFSYMICFEVKDGLDTGGYKTAPIPQQTWAVFRADVKEYGEKIPELFGRVYSEWFPSSGYEKVEGWDMETYCTHPDGKIYEEVWVPVKKR
jgi:AraC family transcriptional regulator